MTIGTTEFPLGDNSGDRASQDARGASDPHAILALQRRAFLAEGPPSAAERRHRIDRLVAMIVDNTEAYADAMATDFGTRSRTGMLFAETMGMPSGIEHTRSHLHKWMGRLVQRAAAENLVPVTLELGGKNPVVVSSDADISRAAVRITRSRMVNGDYVNARTSPLVAYFVGSDLPFGVTSMAAPPFPRFTSAAVDVALSVARRRTTRRIGGKRPGRS